MKKEVEIDDALPAPGEPLTPRVDESNQALIQEEMHARAERARGKLSRREKSRLEKRYKILWKQLRKANWNQLVSERWKLFQKYQELKHAYVTAKNAGDKKKARKIAPEAVEISRRGRKLNAAIAKLQPLADEFADIRNRLETHRQILRFEAEEAENLRAFRREATVWEEQIKAVFRQSKRLHHAGYDTQGNYFCEIPIIERVIFREDRVLYMVKVSSQTWLRKWRSALPYNVDIPDLTCEETLENLSAATNRVVTVVRSKKGQRLFYCINRLDSPDGIPNRVLYSKVMPWYPVQDHAKTPWSAGVTDDRKTKWFDFEDCPHILIAGSTKSGKSNQINAMIATLVTMNSPRELRLLLIDNKGGIEFTHWQGIKHAARPMIKNAGEVLPALQWARKIMERRLATFEAIKAKNLMSYNAKVADESRLPRLVIVIDEMATLLGLGDLTTDIQTELRVLSSQGRAVGVHIVVCTQHSSADVLPGWIKTNMVLRISGKMPSFHASMTILDSASASELPDIVGRMVFALGRYEVIAQTPYISDEEIARAVSISQEYANPDNSEFEEKVVVTDDGEEVVPAILTPVVRFGRDDLIKLALQRFGGKLTAIHMHALLTNDVITLRNLRQLIKEVIEGPQIVYDGMIYRLKKDRRNYILVPQPNEMNGEVDTEGETQLDSLDRSEDDTEEFEVTEEYESV